MKGRRRVLIKVRHFTTHSKVLMQYIDLQSNEHICHCHQYAYVLFACLTNLALFNKAYYVLNAHSKTQGI